MEIESKQPRKPPPIEQKPTMLKDFLRDDFSSCSSSGFRSFPRRSCYTSVRTLLEMDLKASDSKNPKKLPRSQSKAPIGTISAFQKASEAVVNVLKHFEFPSPSKQGILPRSLSRKLKRSFSKRSDKDKREIRVIVKVKDIIKWRSFRDFVEGKDNFSLSSSPIRTTTTTTTTTTASNSNSWSDSDFTSECLHSFSGSSEYSGENEIEECKKYLPEKQKTNKITKVVEEDSMQKDESRDEDKDQFSPVSVLDFPFEEDEDSSSFSQSSLENLERTKHKLMQKTRRFESLPKLEPVNLDKRILSLESDDSLDCHSDSYSSSVNNEVEPEQEEDREYIKAEEQARELLKIIKKNSSEENCIGRVDRLLVDFLRDEIMQRNHSKRTLKECEDKELLKVATDWVNGNVGLLDWGLEESRGAYYKEIEKGGGWGQFEEEKGEIVSQMETEVYNSLMDELLLDFLC